VEEWRSGGVEEWRSGGVEEWRSGGVEKWRSGGVYEYMNGDFGRDEELGSGEEPGWTSPLLHSSTNQSKGTGL
jgi:hypothetical protein